MELVSDIITVIVLVMIMLIILIIFLEAVGSKARNALIKNWQQFSESYGLNFEKGGKYFGDPIISGNFLGHFLSIKQKVLNKQLGTIFELKRNNALKHKKNSYTDRDIMHRFKAIFNIIKSGIDIEITPKRILFSTIIRSSYDLHSISSQLVKLIELYPNLYMIADNAVNFLIQDKPFKQITQAIIESICLDTELRIKPNISLLLCKKCFTHCSSHKVKGSFSSSNILPTSFRYYGCRLCRQSRDLIEGRSVAALDNLMTEEWSVQKNRISVNWLTIRKPFDFHEVRIKQASDREVEEFVMQAGNDMDEFRQPRYKEMPCIIASDCKLSENTLRILKHTFKSVKEV